MGSHLSSQPRFVSSGDGDVPEGALVCGQGASGDEYVGRVYHDGCMLIGRVVPEDKMCYVGYRGEQIGINKYQVLVASESEVEFVEAAEGEVPRGAIIAGHNQEKKPLYVARAEHDGATCAGNLNPEYESVYVAHDGEEHTLKQYQVLCAKHVVLQ